MPLPEGSSRTPWPPLKDRPALSLMTEHDAWYSGDAERLSWFYGTLANRQTSEPFDNPWWKFYGRNNYQGGQRTRGALHVPLAGDIAATSSAMLFGGTPTISIPEAHEDTKNPEAEATEEVLRDLIERGGLYHRLAEAAEQASAIGGVYLKIAWDQSVSDIPMILVQQGDSAIPEFRMGILRAVTFWRVIYRDQSTVIRHLERYEPGVILHGLYRGTDDVLGPSIPLTEQDATADLQPSIPLPEDDMLAVRYIPNARPNRRFRDSYLGQSDYAGIEGLFDALDETYTSWVRDVRLAKARLLVPEEYINHSPTTRARFDVDEEIFSPLSIEPGQDKTTITASQFAIRSAEHEQMATNLIERAVTSAGYAPQTFGLHIEGRADAAIALRIRERKTQITRDRKAQLWQPNLSDMLHMLMIVNTSQPFSGEGDPNFRPRLEIHDGLPDDWHSVAESVERISRAGAASTETLVRLLHPEWDDAEVLGEVDRIQSEKGMNVPDPTTIGLPPEDEDEE